MQLGIPVCENLRRIGEDLGETHKKKHWGVIEMNFFERIAMATLVAALGLGLCPGSKAQVSCSPKVLGRTCREAARILDPMLPLIGESKGHERGSIRVEIVSPQEYKVRVGQLEKGLNLAPHETPGCGPNSQKSFFQNCAIIDVVFIRENSSDLTPHRVLASSDEAEDPLMLAGFLEGYYAGMTAEIAESQIKE